MNEPQAPDVEALVEIITARYSSFDPMTAAGIAEAILAAGWISPASANTIEILQQAAIDDWSKEVDRLKAERARLRTLIRDVRVPLDDPQLPFQTAAIEARKVFQAYDADRAAEASS